MVNQTDDGIIDSNFPFWHFQNLSDSDISINSDIVLNIKNTISTNITAPFPEALHIVHLNVEDLICHFSDVHELFFSSGIHIILISETWLKPFHSDNLVQIAGYTFHRHDRVGKGGGGVGVYIRDDLSYNFVASSNLEIKRPEFLFFEVSINSFKILCGVVYKPPQVGFLSDIEDTLLDILPNYDHIIIAGDFNTNLLENSRRSINLKNMFNSLSLDILPLSATYQHSLLYNPTLLDLLICNNKNKIINHGQISDHSISKHHLIFLSYNIKVPKRKSKIISFRNFKGINIRNLSADAMNLPWKDVDLFNNIEEKVDFVNNLCTSLLDKHAPLRTIRVTRPPAPWIDDNIKYLMKCRDAAGRISRRNKTQQNIDKYKNLRNKVKQLIRNNKLKFLHNVLNPKLPSKVLWKNIHKYGVSNNNELKFNNNIQLDQLNNYFSTLPYNIEFLSKLRTIQYIEDNCMTFDFPKFKLRAVSLSVVRNAFKRIKSNATGVDGFSITFINWILRHILPAVTHIFNYCITNSVFPSVWKCALVRPIPKCKNPADVSDWRPICILPVFSKALEYIIFDQLDDYIESNKLYNTFQSGFRKLHSTSTTLINISDEIRKAKDEHKISFLILLDFSKAFNCINYDILCSKLLNFFNFSRDAADFMLNFLQGRSQSTMWGDQKSDFNPLIGGVPQGTIGGPKIFNLYVNDLLKIIRSCITHAYADDFQLLFTCKISEMVQCVNNINSNLCNISDWGKSNGIILNVKKCKVILFGQQNDLNNVNMDTLPAITIDNELLEFCNTVNNLGLHFDPLLSWEIHVRNVSKKVMGNLYALNRQRNFIPKELKPKLIQSLIFPHFFYCDIVYQDISQKLKLKLQKLQNACVRFACNLKKYDHISPSYKILKWQKMDVLREFHIACFVFKAIHCQAFPSYIKNLFISLSESHGRATRSRDSLILKMPNYKLNAFKFSFVCSAVRLWNALHFSVRAAKTLTQFKTLYSAKYFI
jgi:hypothetical protein